jgi:hypothetical protein
MRSRSRLFPAAFLALFPAAPAESCATPARMSPAYPIGDAEGSERIEGCADDSGGCAYGARFPTAFGAERIYGCKASSHLMTKNGGSSARVVV